MNRRFVPALVALGACAVGAWPAVAGAQGLSAPNVGTGASGPAEDDPAAVYWNPAMLGFTRRPTVLAGGSLILGRVGYQRERRASYQRSDSLAFALPIPTDSLDPGKTGTAPGVTATPAGLSPTFFAAIPLVRDRVVAGFGIYSPFAAILSFDPNGAQRWQLQGATIATVFVTPSVAVRVSDAVSFGAGVSYVLGFTELAKVQDFAALGDVGTALANPPIRQRNSFGAMAPPGVRELDVMARPIRLRAWGSGVTFNAGVALRPARNLTVGLSYQHSTAMTFSGSFQLDMNDPFFTRDLASQGLRFSPLVQGDATVSFPLPRSLFLGVNWDATRHFGLGLMVGYTTWSQVEYFDVRVRSPDLAQPTVGLADTSQIRLPRRWMDTVAVELTARFTPAPRWMLWLTGGYHSPAAPDQTIDVASPDGDRIIAAAGARLTLSDRWRFFADAEVQAILPRHVVASDYDLANGDYSLAIVNLGLHGQYTF